MNNPVHTVDVIGGSNVSMKDRIIVGKLEGIANAAGGGAGLSVTTAVSMTLPTNYTVLAEMSQDATYYITSKTTTGFNVVMNPRLAANTLASGSFNVVILS